MPRHNSAIISMAYAEERLPCSPALMTPKEASPKIGRLRRPSRPSYPHGSARRTGRAQQARPALRNRVSITGSLWRDAYVGQSPKSRPRAGRRPGAVDRTGRDLGGGLRGFRVDPRVGLGGEASSTSAHTTISFFGPGGVLMDAYNRTAIVSLDDSIHQADPR